jgi:hypothetical protein
MIKYDFADAHFNLSIMYKKLKRDKEAKETYEKGRKDILDYSLYDSNIQKSGIKFKS